MLTFKKNYLRDLFERYFYIVGAIITVGYVALTLGTTLYRSQGIMPVDSYTYIKFATLVTELGWAGAVQLLPRQAEFPPLLTVMMVALHHCGLPLEMAGRILNVGSCLLAALGVWSCCFKLYRRHITQLSVALLVCSLPGWYEYGKGILRDPLYWTIVLWCSWLWLIAGQSSVTWRKRCIIIFIIGILSGIGWWCRKEMLIFSFLELMALLGWQGMILLNDSPKFNFQAIGKTLIYLVLLILPQVISLSYLATNDYGYTPWKMVKNTTHD